MPLLSSCYLIRDDVLAKKDIIPLYTVTDATFQGWDRILFTTTQDVSNFFKDDEYCTNAESSWIFSTNARRNDVDLLVSSRFDFGFIK